MQVCVLTAVLGFRGSCIISSTILQISNSRAHFSAQTLETHHNFQLWFLLNHRVITIRPINVIKIIDRAISSASFSVSRSGKLFSFYVVNICRRRLLLAAREGGGTVFPILTFTSSTTAAAAASEALSVDRLCQFSSESGRKSLFSSGKYPFLVLFL
jgi:hypothetical protein